MLSYQSWLLTEASAKPVIKHLTHLEDLILTGYAEGANQAVGFIQSVANQLRSSTKASLNFSVKIDGSPSLVAGIDPGDGRFFIGTKGVFAKTPKLAKSHEDINNLYSASPGLSELMREAFDALKGLSWSGIMQGDVLFTSGSKKIQEVNGVKYVTFKPNTILYAVPVNSNLGAKVLAAKFGISFHTTYTGKTIETISAKAGANIESLKPTSAVLLLSNKYRDLSGTVTLNFQETAYVQGMLSQIQNINKTLSNNKFLALIKQSTQLRDYLMQFQNSLVRNNKSITLTPKTFAVGFVAFLTEKMEQEIKKRNTSKGQENVRAQFGQIISAVKSVAYDLVQVSQWQSLVVSVKTFLVKKLSVASALETFYETGSGIVAGSHEGFVATDSNNNFVKLVDRSHFSRMNFMNNA